MTLTTFVDNTPSGATLNQISATSFSPNLHQKLKLHFATLPSRVMEVFSYIFLLCWAQKLGLLVGETAAICCRRNKGELPNTFSPWCRCWGCPKRYLPRGFGQTVAENCKPRRVNVLGRKKRSDFTKNGRKVKQMDSFEWGFNRKGDERSVIPSNLKYWLTNGAKTVEK